MLALPELTRSHFARAFWLIALAFLSQSAPAEPLKPHTLPEGQNWVVHLNVDAVWQSQLGTLLKSQLLVQEKVDAWFDRFAEHTGIDLRKDLCGITVYGEDLSPESGVVLVYGTRNDEVFWKHLADKRKFAEMEFKGLRGARWELHHKQPDVLLVVVSDELIILARGTKRLSQALEAVRRDEPPAADPLLATPAENGAFLLLRMKNLAALAPKLKSPVFIAADQFRLDLGEAQGSVFARAVIVGNDEKAAEQIEKLILTIKEVSAAKLSKDEMLSTTLEAISTRLQMQQVIIQWRQPPMQVALLAHKVLRLPPPETNVD